MRTRRTAASYLLASRRLQVEQLLLLARRSSVAQQKVGERERTSGEGRGRGGREEAKGSRTNGESAARDAIGEEEGGKAIGEEAARVSTVGCSVLYC
jgi:hypothetical protein